jgi:hypothetical protein
MARLTECLEVGLITEHPCDVSVPVDKALDRIDDRCDMVNLNFRRWKFVSTDIASVELG